MTILSPAMFFLVGISHKEFGYDYLHRIYGEYKSNYTVKGNQRKLNNFLFLVWALIDLSLFLSLYLISWALPG